MKQDQPRTDRRGFLKGAALGGAAAVGGAAGISAPVQAQTAAPAKPSPADAARLASDEAAAAAELGSVNDIVSPLMVKDPGSDFMVDCLRSLGIEYMALNPGGSTSGLHESLINYAGNTNPEIITVTHEENGAAFADGYYKATGKPMAMLFYGVVGLQHASMAVFNAWADRVPMLVLAGDRLDGTRRPIAADWNHAAIDLAPLLTGSIKWYDQPTTLQGLAEALTRGYRIAMTEPRGPVLITINHDLQSDPCNPPRDQLTIPTYHPPVQPVGDPAALKQAAQMLLDAKYPVIIADRTVESQEAMDNLVKLAELLGAPVINKVNRLCMPNRHPLNLTGKDAEVQSRADVMLCLDVDELYPLAYRQSVLTQKTTRFAKPDLKMISISALDYVLGKNIQDGKRFYSADLPITGSGSATLPYLIAAVQQAMTPGARARADARAAEVAKEQATFLPTAHADAAYGWDASPISVARLVSEIGVVLKDENWSLVTNQTLIGTWAQRLWNFDRYDKHLGYHGAGGLGYSAGASIGAALGSAKMGRLAVAIQTDGDLMYQPGAFWTAAHHRIPLLSVMHNNQVYGQELMNVQGIAGRRGRGVANISAGLRMTDPEIDFAMVIKGLGVWTAGPISDPKELRPALERALKVVKSGLPALIDVRTQQR